MSNIGDQRNALTIQGLAAQAGPQSYTTTTDEPPFDIAKEAIDGPRSLEDIVNDIDAAEAAQKRLPGLRKELNDQLAALGLELRKIRKTKGTP